MQIEIAPAFDGILLTDTETSHQLLFLQEEFLEFCFRFRRLCEWSITVFRPDLNHEIEAVGHVRSQLECLSIYVTFDGQLHLSRKRPSPYWAVGPIVVGSPVELSGILGVGKNLLRPELQRELDRPLLPAGS